MTAYWNEDKFADLPLLTPRPCKVDDSDIRFDSDMQYFRDLLVDIQVKAMKTHRAQLFPPVLTDELDHALVELAGIKDFLRDWRRHIETVLGNE
jgi:hypothetical protein